MLDPTIQDPALTQPRSEVGWLSSFLGRSRRGAPAFLVLTVMTLYVWRLTLTGNRTLIHGDSIVFGLPLFKLRADALTGHGSAFWANTIFGGYPPYSESQGGFLGLIPMLMAAIVSPVGGLVMTANLYRVVCMVLTGLGMLGLARSLGLSRWAALFAALAVVFSPLWLYCQTNPALGSPYLYVPWCLWAMEVWLKRPDVRSGVLLGATMGGCVLAGYPQAAQGTVVYMALTLVTAPFAAADRAAWLAGWRTRLVSGLIGVLFALGLSAALLLPLFELVGQSHRSGGVPLQFQIPASFFLRGMLYTLAGDVRTTLAFPGNGSLIVCVLASVAILFDRSSRIVGHLIAALVLMQLGLGNASPIFRVAYDWNLVPGMHYFRNTGLYLIQWSVGAALVGGAAIDGFARWAGRLRASIDRTSVSFTLAGLLIIGLAWIALLSRLHTPGAPIVQFTVVIAAAVAIGGAAAVDRVKWIPALVGSLLVLECVALRLDPFHVASVQLLEEPGSVHAIKSTPGWRDYRVIDASAAPAYAFLDSKSPDVPSGLRRMLSAMSGLTPTLWGLKGMDGAFALPLGRLIEARRVFYDEIDGKTSSPPGARLIDLLAIRYIAVDRPPATPALAPFWSEPGNVTVMENTAARPRFQAYENQVMVASPEEALERIRKLTKPVLVLEKPAVPTTLPVTSAGSAQGEAAQSALTFSVIEDRPTRYRFDITAARNGWMFVADANYPGWRATLDGRPVPVFTAQVLGKAVAVPPGRHELALEFRPASVRLGGAIGSLSLLFGVIAWIVGPKLASRGRREERSRL